jgi:predicted PurR-regulated permease PerM
VRREERVVSVRPRTVLTVLAIALAFTVVIGVMWLTRGVVAWILIAIFLAMALDPGVEYLVRRGFRRGTAAVVAFVVALVVIGLIAYLLVPPLVGQLRDFAEAVPGIVDELVRGEGPLGFLQREYQIVDRIRDALEDRGIGGVLGFTDVGLSFARSVVTAVVGVVTTAFLTLFFLLDGKRLYRGVIEALPPQRRFRIERVGSGIQRTVGGYVTGNILLSVVAGGIATAVLLGLGVPYAVPLGVVVAVFDLVPLAGATIAAVIVVLVALASEGVVIAVVLAGFFIVYQQVENHLLQPLVYGRTVQLSPVIVLVAVLIGADLAGILGALGAIPIAGTIQVILTEVMEARRARAVAAAPND